MNPDDALRQFKDEVPALGLLGNSYFVKPSTPLTITPEVQLVCKYLKAYKEVNRVGEGGINVLYPRGILLHHESGLVGMIKWPCV